MSNCKERNIRKALHNEHTWAFGPSVLNMKNKNSLETFELNNKSKLREEAIDRENTLMNVLKSVKSKQSKEDLAGGDSTTSKGNLSGNIILLRSYN